MLPYKVLYAAQLAEAGLVAPAVHYAGLVQAALAALGAKVPPGLLVCRAMVAELEERLRTHAAVREPLSDPCCLCDAPPQLHCFLRHVCCRAVDRRLQCSCSREHSSRHGRRGSR